MKPSGSIAEPEGFFTRSAARRRKLLLSLLTDRGERFTHSLGRDTVEAVLEVRDRLIGLHEVSRNDSGRLAAVDFHKGE